jgi:hypothetical protein
VGTRLQLLKEAAPLARVSQLTSALWGNRLT